MVNPPWFPLVKPPLKAALLDDSVKVPPEWGRQPRCESRWQPARLVRIRPMMDQMYPNVYLVGIWIYGEYMVNIWLIYGEYMVFPSTYGEYIVYIWLVIIWIIYGNIWYNVYLVGGIPTPLRNMSSSVGMMTFPIYGKIKIMFQTTNQFITGDLSG